MRPGRRWIDLVVVAIIAAELLPRATPLLGTARFNRDVVPYESSIGGDTMFVRVGVANVIQRGAWIAGYLNLYRRRFDATTPAPVAIARYLRHSSEVLQRGSP